MTPPFLHNWERARGRTPVLMLGVWGASLPGTAALIWLSGPAILSHVLVASAAALLTEAAALGLRGGKLAVRHGLGDCSALLSGWLVGLLLPVSSPWWLPACGGALAIMIGKQVFGGLGRNPFNPAIIGCLLTLTLFPVANAAPQAFQVSDAFVEFAFLGGGLVLLGLGAFTWHAPFGMLASLALWILIFDTGAGNQAEVFLHGNLMLAAFFLLTDPVTGALRKGDRLLLGVVAGSFTALFLTAKAGPDSALLAILLVNTLALPLNELARPAAGSVKQA